MKNSAATIGRMGKRREERPAEPTQPTRKGREGRYSFYVEIENSLMAVLVKHVDSFRPKTSKKAIVELALERYFESLGLWPPKSTKETGA